MQTIIKELSLNPTIQELMFNADITQIFNQTWIQIICSGILGSLIGGGISGGITWFAMKNTDKIANARWEKSIYKNHECEFWLEFYKEFHIVSRFIRPFLKDMINSNIKYFVPENLFYAKDNGKKYFRDWSEHFDKLFNLVNGYENLYPSKYNFDTHHIWILFAMRAVLQKNIDSGKLVFDKNSMLNFETYKTLHKDFQSYYWDNIKDTRKNIEQELEELYNNQRNDFDYSKLWNYFEEKLDYMENKLKEIIDGDLFNSKK